MREDFLEKKRRTLTKALEHLDTISSEEDYLRKKSDCTVKKRAAQMRKAKNSAFDTVALWGLYSKEDMMRYKSLTLPLFTTTAGGPHDSLLDGELMLSYQTTDDPNKVYSRIDNINPDHLAWKFAALEGFGVPELTQGLCTSSGMSAIMMATMPFMSPGDNCVSSNRTYGGTQQLFEVTFPNFGWSSRWVDEPWKLESWKEKIDEKTKFLFVESPSNPTLYVADIKALSDLAHEHGIPLIVDSTLASPALSRPLQHGADIVVHSISKVANGSCRSIGGVIVAKETITTKTEELRESYALKLKGGHFRNLGSCLSPFNAMLVWDEMGTIRMRMKEHCRKAMKIATFLDSHPMIEHVNYPGLPNHPQHELAKSLLRFPDGENGFGYLMSFNIKGGLEKAAEFAGVFDFGAQVTHLGGSYTVWVHNATTTHGQMTSEERKKAGVVDNMIRYSVGLEGADDAIASLDRALRKIQ